MILPLRTMPYVSQESFDFLKAPVQGSGQEEKAMVRRRQPFLLPQLLRLGLERDLGREQDTQGEEQGVLGVLVLPNITPGRGTSVAVAPEGASASWGHCSQEEGSGFPRKLPWFVLRALEKHALVQDKADTYLFFSLPSAKAGDRKSRTLGRKVVRLGQEWGKSNEEGSAGGCGRRKAG